MDDSRARLHTEGGSRCLEWPTIIFGHVGSSLRIEQKCGVPNLRCDLLEDFEPFRCHGRHEIGESRGVATRSGETLHEAASDRIGYRGEHDGDTVVLALQCGDGDRAESKDRVQLHRQKLAGKAPVSLGITSGPPFVDLQIAAYLPAELFKPLIKRDQPALGLRVVADAHQDADASRSLSLLRVRAERPSCRRTAEQRDELAPSHHSITSSARADTPGGTSRPSAFAVIRLMTNSNLVDCIAGRSAGLA